MRAPSLGSGHGARSKSRGHAPKDDDQQDVEEASPAPGASAPNLPAGGSG